jgi:sugar transferase (PEP-CTERM system associated)
MRLKLLGRYVQAPLAMLWIAELAVTLFACRLAGHLLLGDEVTIAAHWLLAILYCACVMIAMTALGLFSHRLRDQLTGVIMRITIAVLGGSIVAIVLMSTWASVRVAISLASLSAAFAWLGLTTTRLVGLKLIDEDRFKRRIVVYGTGQNAMQVARLRRRADQRGFKLIGFLRAEGEESRVDPERIVHPSGSLREYARQEGIDEIVVAMDDRRGKFPHQEFIECRLAGIEIMELISFLERETGKVYLKLLNPSWLIFSSGFRRDFLRLHSERTFDLIVSLLLLVVASPFIVLTCIAIKLEDGLRAPVFYRQERVGYGGRIFDVLKFRSMRVDAEREGKALWAAVDDARVTRVGSFIRKVRIDELPQLLNVFRGEMSFVGPRPERPEFVAKLAEAIPYYQERHSVKPGITGWAQLCYAYGSSEKDAIEKLQYDLFYVKHHDLLFDLLILLQTVEVILLGKGAR